MLSALFLFNLYGYRIVFAYMQHQSDVAVVAMLDETAYTEDELVTIKVPVSMPYQYERTEFERVNGEITLEGKIYKYVQRKIVGGELVLQCLPDHHKLHLQKAEKDFGNTVNDFVQHSTSKKSGHSGKTKMKLFSSDYMPIAAEQYETSTVVSQALQSLVANNQLPTAPHTSPEQPPECFS